jgi:hypothetical protein
VGTDIHTTAEIHRKRYADDPDETPLGEGWVTIEEQIFPYPYFRESEPVSIDNTPFTSRPFPGRNYDLFAVLADVRNGTGFAGVDRGDRIEPIAEPKGVPSDATPEWLKEVERWGVDFHSHSYFTVAELLSYDWDKLMFHRGYIEAADYLKLRGTNEQPLGWSGGISGGKVKTVSAAEYDDLLAAGKLDADLDYYVQYQWSTTVRDAVGAEFFTCLDTLVASCPIDDNSPPWAWQDRRDGKPDPRVRDYTKVRVVFAFDN